MPARHEKKLYKNTEMISKGAEKGCEIKLRITNAAKTFANTEANK